MDNKICKGESKEILPHQQKIVDHMNKTDQKGILVYYSLGSGKTATAINFLVKTTFKYTKIFLVMRKILEKNMIFEITKFGQDQLIPMIHPELTDENTVIIFDDFHDWNNSLITGDSEKSKLYDKIMAKQNCKVLILTGTPILEYSFEISSLFNLIVGKEIFPRSGAEFKIYINQKTGKVLYDDYIKKKIRGYVAYFDKIDKEIIVPKPKIQIVPYYIKDTYTYNILSLPEKKEYEDELKVDTIVALVRKSVDKIGNIFLYYENKVMLDNVLKQLSDIKSIIIDTSNYEIVNSVINTPKNPYKLICGSYDLMYGVSLFNITTVIVSVMKMSFSDYTQILGRARRICSHVMLPKDVRKIRCFLLMGRVGVMSRFSVWTTGDEKIYESAVLYERLNDSFNKLIKSVSI